MYAKIQSSAIVGLKSLVLDIEVTIRNGTGTFVTVGLPDLAVRESRDRVLSALRYTGNGLVGKNCTVNLAPASIRKEGPVYDLPIALGIILASHSQKQNLLEGYLILGELALDGKVRPVRGVLPAAIGCKQLGFKGMILPQENVSEAAFVEGIHIVGITNLTQAIGFLVGEWTPPPVVPKSLNSEFSFVDCDFSEVKGQVAVKRALTIAATGFHNMLMIGPPGCGKTLMAKRLPSIMPNLSFQEALEVSKIHSVMGMLPPDQGLVLQRPFRTPHHTISEAGLVGGGTHPHPGEISLAHYGILFLDELPEFRKRTLEVLRQPLEDQKVTISRVNGSYTFPCSTLLVATMNGCPCGQRGLESESCRCTEWQVKSYRGRISTPLLERIDLHIEVRPVEFQEITQNNQAESSETLRAKVLQTQQIQQKRFQNEWKKNGQMSPKEVEQFCELGSQENKLLEMAMKNLKLSARSLSKIRKIARSIADLDAQEKINCEHLSEAVHYRTLDKWN
ncbi:MAG: YifB family Mg chelatase-like AAA ATPase [Planctomycetota bacterium]